MRELKFRAWNLKNKQMWYDGGHIDLSLSLDGELYTNDAYYSPVKDEFIIMQYTGLKDVNGKEIYEGDVIRLRDSIACIEHDDKHTGFRFRWVDNQSHLGGTTWHEGMLYVMEYEIIGNIYENPDIVPNA